MTIIPFVIDVDGVMTDGTAIYPDGLRAFNVRDGHGLGLLYKLTNINPIMMSGENDPSIQERAKKLNIPFRSTDNKRRLLNNWYSYQEGCPYIAISDDIMDRQLLREATIAFCPADAEEEIKTLILLHEGGVILSKNGGQGCVREAINMLLTQTWLQKMIPDLVVIKHVPQIT